MAESLLWRPFFSSPSLVVGLGLVCGGVALALHSRLGPRTTRSSSGWLVYVPLALPLFYVLGIGSTPLAGMVLLTGGLLLVGLMAWKNRPIWLLPVLGGLIPLGVYVQTLLPSVGEADTFEFQVVVPQLGVAHPTGYPLYVLLGKVFTFLPMRNVAWRVSLSAAVFGAGAVVIVYLVARELNGQLPVRTPAARRDGGRGLFAFLTALAVAFSGTFWSQATAAEVYTLHNLLAMGILLLLLRRARVSSPQAVPSLRAWHGAFFLLGLSLTNHLTTALLAPAFLLALVSDRPEGKAREWVAAAALFALGLSLYLFIPLRWPALNEGLWMSAREFLRYVTGGQFHGALRLDGWRDPARWRIVGRLLKQPYGWPGIALAAVGTAGLMVRRRLTLTITGITFAAFFAYGLNYHVADIAVFLLPAHLILGIWMGAGALLVADWLSGQLPGSGAAWLSVAAIFFALIPLSNLWGNYEAADRSRDRGGVAWGRYALEQPLDEGSALLADTTKFAPLYYLQQVEGVRPDLDMVLLGTEAEYQRELRRRLDEGQTVYLARYLPQLHGLYLRSVGPFAEVQRAPPDPERLSGPPLAEATDRIDLLDAGVARDPLGRPVRHVMLRWRAVEPVDGDLEVRLRLVDEEGRARWETEGTRPVNGLYPTNAWPEGVSVTDYHEVRVPAWLPMGEYGLEVALSRPFFEDAAADADEGLFWTSLGGIEVEQRPDREPLPNRHAVAFDGGGWLTGSDVPDAVVAGGPVAVELSWEGIDEDKQVYLTWEGAVEGGTHNPAHSLTMGTVRSRQAVSAPLQTGQHVLRLGMVGRQVHCIWLGAPEESCPVARINVIPTGEGLANFGDRVLLRNAELGIRAARPGDVVRVSLWWRALRAMAIDYTVFVQLIGPDGRLHGQVDSWPVQGTYATSEWIPGRDVSDQYEVRLEPDAPPGEYRVVVGLYELATMERLRVLNPEGRPIGDSHIVGRLDVRR